MTLVEIGWILGSGLATSLGGVLLLFFPRPSDRLLDGLSGFTAGVMLAASSFSLLVPALERGSVVEVLGGFAAGGGCFAVLDRFLPHIHLRFAETRHDSGAAAGTGRETLLLLALAIHNIPEGLVVGVAFAAGGIELGVPIALAIGIQNVPEGFAAGAPLVGEMGRGRASAVAGLTGIVEPPAAVAAVLALGIASQLLPLGLGFAAGAMVYVVVDELIPESHARGNERLSTLALLVGFALMLSLDNILG